jgi:hypothetical protein
MPERVAAKSTFSAILQKKVRFFWGHINDSCIYTKRLIACTLLACDWLLTINQMKLRMMLGSFYIAYYATAAADPLYGGIFTTMGMMLTNLNE